MKTLFLVWHLGVGDALICCGMVRVLAREYDKVILPAKTQNVATVAWMFSDVPQVVVVPVREDREMLRLAQEHRGVILELGVWSKRGLKQPWSEGFYDDAMMPFEWRWSEFKLPITPNVCHRVGSVFIHEDRKRDYHIALKWPEKPNWYYLPNKETPFENHIPWLQDASEIHVIDSCFLCLADSIETQAKRHVLHLYATAHDPYKKYGPPTLRKNWEILR